VAEIRSAAGPEPARPEQERRESARSAILGRVRSALGDHPKPPEVARTYRRDAEPGTDVVALFAERAADYRATVEIVEANGLPAAIAAVLYAHGVRRIAVPADLPEHWLGGAPEADGPESAWLRDDPPLSVSDLDGADGVVTAAALAIALTGTVILDAGAGQGRRVLSLLPDLHVCVVRTDQIVATVAEAIARLDGRRPQTWISGPSATSDIELNRVEGVHGPRTLHIIVVR
jgi:L-lactate dehydrogenase complex protein LldG